MRFITSCPSFQNPEPDAFAFDKYYFRRKWFPFGNIILFWEIWPSRKQSSPVFCQVLLQFRKPTFLIQQPQYILIPIFETEAQNGKLRVDSLRKDPWIMNKRRGASIMRARKQPKFRNTHHLLVRSNRLICVHLLPHSPQSQS